MRRYFKQIICFIIILSSVTYVYGGQAKKENFNGFEIISMDYVESIDSDVITYSHFGTGAQVVHVKNSDPNRVFAIGFKTPVHDNTGVNHIVEHTVFTGSEKYNIKDVFFEMKKKSPNIFMNASTAVDMTIYPFSTRNQKDYNNLLDVYLDGVFFPNLQNHRRGFDQEGWHYSIDEDEKYQLNGVVYNEMKGASVAPRRILAMANRKAMFPDTMYVYNAGGNPEDIPTLSYEQCKKTHKEYYVPSNSLAFVYGDVDIIGVLTKLSNYYGRFTKQKAQNINQIQPPFEGKQYYTEDYPATSNEDHYLISTNFAVGTIGDLKLQLSMEILMDILTKYEDSPLRKAFIQQQSSKTLSYDIDAVIPQPMYSIITTDVKEENIKDVEILINETLQKVRKEGFHKDLINRAINNYEIRMKQKLSNISKGIDMAYNTIYGWGHGVSPITMLQSQELIDEIKEGASSQYFQGLLEAQLLDNNHQSQVVLAPDKNYIAKAQNREALDIKKQEKNSTWVTRTILNWNKGKLDLWQQQEDKGDLPDLKLVDINQGSTLPRLETQDSKIGKTMYYVGDVNDLIYMDLYFDASYVPQESLNELFLFAHLVSQKEKNTLHPGGIGSDIVAIPEFGAYNKYLPKLRLSLEVEKENLKKGFKMLEEIARHATWDDQWVLGQIRKIRRNYDNYFAANPLELMTVSVASSDQGASRYAYEKTIPFYHYICQLEDHYDQYKDQVISKLKTINQSVFNKENMVLGATLEEENIKALEKNYKRYRRKLKSVKHPQVEYTFNQGEKRQGFEIASDVQYIVWGGNYIEKGGAYTGAMYVLGNILNGDYLLQNIRVKNGAYGAGIKFSPYGNMDIYTYQDPKLLESLSTIVSIPTYIEDLEIDQDILDGYKIGAFSNFERELGLNESPAAIGRTLQSYYLSGLTSDKLEQIRAEIFQATMSDIKAQAVIFEKLLQDQRYSVAGSKSKLLTHTDHFDIIQ